MRSHTVKGTKPCFVSLNRVSHQKVKQKPIVEVHNKNSVINGKPGRVDKRRKSAPIADQSVEIRSIIHERSQQQQAKKVTFYDESNNPQSKPKPGRVEVRRQSEPHLEHRHLFDLSEIETDINKHRIQALEKQLDLMKARLFEKDIETNRLSQELSDEKQKNVAIISDINMKRVCTYSLFFIAF